MADLPTVAVFPPRCALPGCEAHLPERVPGCICSRWGDASGEHIMRISAACRAHDVPGVVEFTTTMKRPVGEPVRAKDVQVAHIYQARCRRPGCEWVGELLGSYQEANSDRQAHLDWHRTGEQEAGDG